MKLCFLELWSVFVAAGVSPHIIFLTVGELGIQQGSGITPDEMRKIREREAEQALNFLNATLTILSFPDLELSFIPFEQLVLSVLSEVRQHEADVLFSFHPNEVTREFDHPDHTIAGQVARYVSAAADVEHLLPDVSAQKTRPQLYLWTTEKKRANKQILLPKTVRKNRNHYLKEFYPSQFPGDSETAWKKIFDSITKQKKNHIELYQKVR